MVKKKKKKATIKKVAKKAIKKKPAKKRIVKRKPVKKAAKASKAKAVKKAKEGVIGIITHYFPHVKAAVVKLKAPLSVGDSIKVKGHTTDFTQIISSLQIDRVPVQSAKKGAEIGIQVNSRVRQHDTVYKAK
jgi:hypothetical protein